PLLVPPAAAPGGAELPPRSGAGLRRRRGRPPSPCPPPLCRRDAQRAAGCPWTAGRLPLAVQPIAEGAHPDVETDTTRSRPPPGRTHRDWIPAGYLRLRGLGGTPARAACTSGPPGGGTTRAARPTCCARFIGTTRPACPAG